MVNLLLIGIKYLSSAVSFFFSQTLSFEMELQMRNVSNITQPIQPTEPLLTPQAKIISYSFLFLWSFIGNVLVIAVVYWNKNLRTSFNYLIVNMAVSDLFVPLAAVPLQIFESTRDRRNEWFAKGPFGEALCKLSFFLVDISPGVSVFSLVIIAFNRFFAIAYPVRGLNTFHRKKDLFLIGLTWVVPCALLSSHFYTLRLHYTEQEEYPQCVRRWDPAFDNKSAQDIFIGILIIAVFVIPFIIITTLYAVMIHKIIKASKQAATMMNRRQTLYRQKKNKQIFYLSVIIVVGFAVLWGPFFIYLFILQYIWVAEPPIPLEQVNFIFFIFQFMGYSTAIFNPTIYFLFFQNYRQGLQKMLTGKTRRVKRSSQLFSRSQGNRLSRLSLLTDSINEYLSKKRRSKTSAV